MTEQPPSAASRTAELPPAAYRSAEYRIEDLAQLSGATVRTIRAYQDRGLLPRPERRGRANVYGDAHLARLRQIADLLDRGYTLASIKELLAAWDAGLDLGGVLGLVAEIDGPWTDEQASRISRADLDAAFGGSPDETALAEAVELGVLERLPGRDDAFLVPSPRELAVAVELHSAGVPLTAISEHLRELRGQVEHIASRFLDFTTEHVFRPFLDHPPTEDEAAEAAALVRRLRPLAQQTIDAELARAMRTLATRSLRQHLSGTLPAEERQATVPAAPATAPEAGTTAAEATPTAPATAPAVAPTAALVTAPVPDDARRVPRTRTSAEPDADSRTTTDPEAAASEAVVLPAEAVRAVRALVGAGNTAAFITAAARREVQARAMDALASGGHRSAPPAPDTRPDGADAWAGAPGPQDGAAGPGTGP